MQKNPNSDALKHHFNLPEHLQVLKDKLSKEIAIAYKNLAHKYLLAVTELDDKVYKSLSDLLTAPNSYEPNQKDKDKLAKAGQIIIDLLDDTADLSCFRISALYDLIDESRTNLYPLIHLKFDVRSIIEEMCIIVMEINDKSNQYVGTMLVGLMECWGMELPIDRFHNDFLRLDEKGNFTPKEKKQKGK